MKWLVLAPFVLGLAVVVWDSPMVRELRERRARRKAERAARRAADPK